MCYKQTNIPFVVSIVKAQHTNHLNVSRSTPWESENLFFHQKDFASTAQDHITMPTNVKVPTRVYIAKDVITPQYATRRMKNQNK